MIPPDINQISPVSIETARGLMRRGEPWRVRLVFSGSNAKNASGVSNKWWQAAGAAFDPAFKPTSTPPPRERATVSWGATGSAGQFKGDVDGGSALSRAAEKLAKGYVYAPDAGSPTRVDSLQDLVNRATWRTATRDRILLLAGQDGWVSLSLPATATVNGVPVLPFLAADRSLWGVVSDAGGSLSYAKIRA